MWETKCSTLGITCTAVGCLRRGARAGRGRTRCYPLHLRCGRSAPEQVYGPLESRRLGQHLAYRIYTYHAALRAEQNRCAQQDSGTSQCTHGSPQCRECSNLADNGSFASASTAHGQSWLASSALRASQQLREQKSAPTSGVAVPAALLIVDTPRLPWARTSREELIAWLACSTTESISLFDMCGTNTADTPSSQWPYFVTQDPVPDTPSPRVSPQSS